MANNEDYINAKDELTEILEQNELTMCGGWVANYDFAETYCVDPKRDRMLEFADCANAEVFLAQLDVKYDHGYGLQQLFGEIYCRDQQDRPVWLTRGEYDGAEWWKVNKIPEFYFKQRT